MHIKGLRRAEVRLLRWIRSLCGSCSGKGVCLAGLLPAIRVAGFNEGAEERVWLKRLGLEFGMKLAAKEIGMARDLDNFDVGLIGG